MFSLEWNQGKCTTCASKWESTRLLSRDTSLDKFMFDYSCLAYQPPPPPKPKPVVVPKPQPEPEKPDPRPSIPEEEVVVEEEEEEPPVVVTPTKPEPIPKKLTAKEEPIVSSANEVVSGEESSSAIGPAIGGAAGGLVVIAGISYLSYTICNKRKKNSKYKQDEENEAGQTKDTINTSKLGLVDGKGFDTEAGNNQFLHGPTKSEGKADITTQNASSHMRSGSPSKASKPIHPDEIAMEVIEFDENDMKSMYSYKPQ